MANIVDDKDLIKSLEVLGFSQDQIQDIIKGDNGGGVDENLSHYTDKDPENPEAEQKRDAYEYRKEKEREDDIEEKGKEKGFKKGLSKEEYNKFVKTHENQVKDIFRRCADGDLTPDEAMDEYRKSEDELKSKVGGEIEKCNTMPKGIEKSLLDSLSGMSQKDTARDTLLLKVLSRQDNIEKSLANIGLSLKEIGGMPIGRKSYTSSREIEKSFGGERLSTEDGKTVINVSTGAGRMELSKILLEKSLDSQGNISNKNFAEAAMSFEASGILEKGIVDQLGREGIVVIK